MSAPVTERILVSSELLDRRQSSSPEQHVVEVHAAHPIVAHEAQHKAGCRHHLCRSSWNVAERGPRHCQRRGPRVMG